MLLHYFCFSRNRANLLNDGFVQLNDGKLGELCVYKDGSVKLHVGQTVFDVMHGTKFQHSEQLACFDADAKKCTFLGSVPGRLVCEISVDAVEHKAASM